MNNTEILGWIATAVFVASYFFAKPGSLRAMQMVGACLWIVYGVMIGALPVIAANALVFTAAAWTFARSRWTRSAAATSQAPHPAS